MSAVVWQDPPPPKRGHGTRGAQAEFVAQLKTRPGEWAVYPRLVTSAQGAQTRQRYRGVEVTLRFAGSFTPAGGRQFHMYCRWIGEA